MVPVDLAHTDKLDKALTVAADLAKYHDAELFVAGVTQSVPTEIAHTPEEYLARLSAFAADQSEIHGVSFKPHSEVSHDITVDLEAALRRAADAVEADLIVMASHVPGLAEYVFASHAGYLASHASISVFVVR